MIISIRGTSGSGKSTLVRKVMDLYPERISQFINGRKQPIMYYLKGAGGNEKGLVVIGHYESPCGGCDTIQSFDDVFAFVRAAADGGYDVLFEGVLLYCEVPRTVSMVQDLYPLHVIALNTPLDVCVESINLRRKAKKPDAEPVDPANTETKHRGTVTTMAKLQAAGVPVFWLDREQAFHHIIEQFNLNSVLA